MIFSAAVRLFARLRALPAAALLLLAGAHPALAHHPFEGVEAIQLNALQGLISGIGHPVLGPDHLLFLVAIAFLGLQRPVRWVLPLLGVGLAGSVLSQWMPLAPGLVPFSEAAVSLSLAAEGLIALGVLPVALLLPLIGLHGFLLGSMVIGAEPTPLLAYGFGLMLSQGLLLLAATSLSRRVVSLLGEHGRRLAACFWIGLGASLAFSALAG